jgi:tetratricopeptide (TPR) repeat protein
MKLSQFKFKLPEEQIAQYPARHRDESRLMVLHKKSQEIEHREYFKDILDYFDDKDVFIFNDTKVFPARLYGNKEKTGARIEVFLLRELNEELRLWDVLVDPARKIRIGNKLYFGEDDSMVAEVIDNTTSRGRTLRFLFDGTHDEFKAALYALGESPLPKHIVKRPAEEDDMERLFWKGRDLYEKEKYELALEYFHEAAAAGHEEAEYYIGTCYLNGFGVPQNLDLANEWLEKAAEHKSVSALQYWGGVYLRVHKDIEKALRYLEEAARRGSSEASESLAYIYEVGYCVPQNSKKALAFSKLAGIQSGYDYATSQLKREFYARD